MYLRNRSPWQVAGWLSIITFALAGCSGPAGTGTNDVTEESPSLGETAEELVGSNWYYSNPSVRFCFETSGYDDFKASFVSGVEREFQNFTNVSLTHAGDCANIDPYGNLVRIVIEEGENQRSYTEMPARIMHLFTDSSQKTWDHELTHALGFRHTQDANGSLCTLQSVISQDAALGPYDPMSLMNYCGSVGPRYFSDLDLMGIDMVYGAPGVLSVGSSGTMFRHRIYRKANDSQQDFRCTLQGAAQTAAFTGLHGAPVGSADSSYNNAPLNESSFGAVPITDVGACAYPPGFYKIGADYYMVVGDQIEVNKAAGTDELQVNPGSVCRIADPSQEQYFSADLLLHTLDPSTNLWLGRASKTMADTPTCMWGDGFYRINGADPVYRLGDSLTTPSICHVVSPAQLDQFQQVGRVVTKQQGPLAGESNVAVPPHLVASDTTLASLATGRSPAGAIPDCAWPDGLYTSNGATYSVQGSTYCHVVDPAQLAAMKGPTPSDVTGHAFFQGPTTGPFSGSGGSGQSGATCLATYLFPVTAGSSYTISTVASFTGDTFVKVTGACSCANDDYGGGLGSQCTCTATSTGNATLCASTYGSSAASWSYEVSGGGGGYTATGECAWPNGWYHSQNGLFNVTSATSVCYVQNDDQKAAFKVKDDDINEVTGDAAFYQFWQGHYAGLCAWPKGLYTQGSITYAIGAGAALPHTDVIAPYGTDPDPINDMCALVNPAQAAVLGSTLDASGKIAWPLFNGPARVVAADSALTANRTFVNVTQQVPQCPWPNGNYSQKAAPGSDPTPYALTRTGASQYDGTISYDCQRNSSIPAPSHPLVETVPQDIWQCPLSAAQMPPLTVTCSTTPCTSTSTLSVHYQGMTGSINDWIAPVLVGQSSDHYVGKKYLPGGQTSGDLVFGSPGPGTWTFRAFINGSYVLRAESAPFVIVTPNPGLIQLSCADTPCTDASTLVASYVNAPTAQDPLHDGYTVQIMPQGGAWNTLLAYQYSQPTTATLLFQGGSLTFASLPVQPAFPVTGSADLVARIYLRDTGALLAESNVVRIWPNLTVTCSTPLCAEGDTVTVTYHNLPAVNSWIELVAASTPRSTSGSFPHSVGRYFAYTDGSLAGSVTFVVKSGDAGAWVARGYKQTPEAGTFGGLTLWLQSGQDSAPFWFGN